MKKTIAVLLISVISIFLIVGCSTEEPYTFEGNNLVMVDDRSFELENIPENSAEETVINDFLYSITGDFDSLQDNLADIEAHKISVKNEKEMVKDDIYI